MYGRSGNRSRAFIAFSRALRRRRCRRKWARTAYFRFSGNRVARPEQWPLSPCSSSVSRARHRNLVIVRDSAALAISQSVRFKLNQLRATIIIIRRRPVEIFRRP